MLAAIIITAILAIALLASALVSMGTDQMYKQQRREIAQAQGRKVYGSGKYSYRK